MYPLKTLAAAPMRSIGRVWARFYPSSARPTREQGARVAADVAMQRITRLMWVDTERRALVHSVRNMDRLDGRVKLIHGRTASDMIRGGLVMQTTSPLLTREWSAFQARLQLNNWEKLKSDARGLVTEGNLALQMVLQDDANGIGAAVRMPSETLVPITDVSGRFSDPGRAFEQRDVMTGERLASFSAWQMALGRLDPDNWDDLGSMGRPMLDACVSTWRKLTMTEEDLVLRRRMRAPLRLSHVLEGATPDEVARYQQTTDAVKGEICTDFYSNRKGGVTAVQGDATLGDINDVLHLLNTFYAGTPLPAALQGYTDGVNRDVLEDMKRQYYDTIDGLQDAAAGVYAFAFRVHLLLRGVDPDPDEFFLRFAKRRAESANQIADLSLKWQALALPDEHIYREMGLDPEKIRAMKIAQARSTDPYPNPMRINPAPAEPPASARADTRVSITPSNARQGESATSVSLPGSNGGRGRG